MRFLNKAAFLAMSLLLCLFSLSLAADQEALQDPAVAKVGNMTISKIDVDLRAQKIMPMQANFHGGVSAEKVAEVRKKAFDELVERAYKVQFAIDSEISIEAGALDGEWKKLLSKNPQLASKEYANYTSKIRANLYLDLLAAKTETVAVDEKISVSEQNVANHYNKNKAQYYRPKLYTASHVFVRVDPSSNAEEIKQKFGRANELFARAKAGEDFYNLAYYESDDRSKYVGGSLGSFHAGQTVPEFDAAIQAMKPGEVFGPVRTMYGFHIIKLDSLEEEKQLSFEEVAGKIRTALVDSERKRIYQEWMSKLKGLYTLQRFD